MESPQNLHLEKPLRKLDRLNPNPNKVSSPNGSSTMSGTYSVLSRDIDRWMDVNPPSTDSTGTAVPNNRVLTVQRSVAARRSILDNSGLWYIMGMLLPLFSIGDPAQWRCTAHSLVIGVAEVLQSSLRRTCAFMRAELDLLSQDRIARELFATAMDIILVIYAFGFLVLSIYQASLFE